jgi:copper chaperone CopZ
VSVAIRKLEGVESVEVSLNEGAADVTLKPGNRVDPESIRQVARDNGFTPKGADVRVAGRLTEHEGEPALAVSGVGLVYRLAELPEGQGRLAELESLAMGKEVLVSGHLTETIGPSPASEPPILQLRGFVLQND